MLSAIVYRCILRNSVFFQEFLHCRTVIKHSMMEFRIMKWRALPKRHPPRDQGQSTGPFYVKIKILQIASHYSLCFSKFSPAIFSINYASDRNSEGALCSSTFFFRFLGHVFSPKFQRICPGEFFFTFENSYFFIIFKNENKFLLDKYVGILG